MKTWIEFKAWPLNDLDNETHVDGNKTTIADGDEEKKRKTLLMKI